MEGIYFCIVLKLILTNVYLNVNMNGQIILSETEENFQIQPIWPERRHSQEIDSMKFKLKIEVNKLTYYLQVNGTTYRGNARRLLVVLTKDENLASLFLTQQLASPKLKELSDIPDLSYGSRFAILYEENASLYLLHASSIRRNEINIIDHEHKYEVYIIAVRKSSRPPVNSFVIEAMRM